MYAILPFGMRVIDKLMAIIDHEMNKVGAQKISLPFLTNRNLWKMTGRNHHIVTILHK